MIEKKDDNLDCVYYRIEKRTLIPYIFLNKGITRDDDLNLLDKLEIDLSVQYIF